LPTTSLPTPTAPTPTPTLSLHDALPISTPHFLLREEDRGVEAAATRPHHPVPALGPVNLVIELRVSLNHSLPPVLPGRAFRPTRSEEHTSELQSRFDLVCRLLLEKKNTP